MTLQEYNDLYKQPLLKSMTITTSGGITITNANIVSETMSLEKSLCSENNLRYGRCEAACFKIRIADLNHDFTGEWLNVVQDVMTDSEGYLLTQNGLYLLTEDGYKIKLKDEEIDEARAVYGRFKAHSDKPSNDRRWRDLTCYDVMYDILNADVSEWYNNLTFPMTLKDLRDSFFNYLGITQVTTTLINDSFVTPGGFSVGGSLSGKTVIESICELNGVFGQITGDGKFEYISLASPETLTLDYYVDGTGSYEDYVTDAVTGINAKGTTNDVGTIVGTDTNLYIIANNPLIYGTEGTTALTTALNTLLRHITAIQFRPFKVTTYGNPMLPLGTQITLNTKNQTIVSYVVRKELNGIQSLKDTISATSDKHQPTAVNSPVTEIKRSQGKIHELEINVDGLTSRVTATETSLSNDYSTTEQMNTAIQQSASAITTQVSNTYVTKTTYNAEIQNLQDQIDGRIEYFDGNVVPTLNNPPASTWITTAEKDSHVGDLYRYHYTVQGVEKTDYYRFDKDTTTNPPTYSWVTLGESETDEALRQAELANQKADAAQAQLDNLQGNIEDNYSTTTQMNSAINQKANEITQTVSTTYETKSDATSKFNTADANAQGYANDALSAANTNAQGYANTALTTARSEITQLSNKVAVKVNSSGRLVTAELGVDPASSTSYIKVKADDIDIISNGNIQLTGKSIGIASTNFSVTSSGILTCTGANVKGDIITDTLKIDNKAYLSIETATATYTSFTLNYDLSTNPYGALSSAVQSNRLLISSGYGLNIPSDVYFGKYVKMNDNALVDKDLQVNGNFLAVGNACVNGWLRCAGTVYVDQEGSFGAGIELGTKSADSPAIIDFHWASTNTDYTARIWQRGENTVDLIGKNSSTWGIWRAASFNSQSSKYVKKNIKNVTEKEARNILKLRPVKFDYKNSDITNQRGLIAEEVLEIMPEMVNVPKDYTGFNKDEPWNTPSIDYSKFVPYLIKMIQIQQKEIDNLKK